MDAALAICIVVQLLTARMEHFYARLKQEQTSFYNSDGDSLLRRAAPRTHRSVVYARWRLCTPQLIYDGHLAHSDRASQRS